VLTLVDMFSRFSPALEPRFTFRGVDVVEVRKGSADKWSSRPQSASTKGPSLYHAIWICGPISGASRSTSPGQVYCSPVLRHPAGLIQAANFRSAIAF